MNDLVTKKCAPCEGGVEPMTATEIATHQKMLDPAWQVNAEGTQIFRDFKFNNYYETMAFVNGIAWFTHQEDHHPDLEVGYGHCLVRYNTHAIGGLSINDFICAAKVDALV